LDYSYYSNFQNKCLGYFIKLTDTRFADQVTIEAWVTGNPMKQPSIRKKQSPNWVKPPG
jgi:hypothetical protein